MAHRIPGRTALYAAIEAAVRKTPHVETQNEFGRLVRKELSKLGSGFGASDVRIRRLAIEKGLVRISIEYRASESKAVPRICPVCGNALSSVRNMTLDGESAEISRKCSVCPYVTGKTPLVPSKYSFTASSGSGVPDNVRIARALERAGAKLHEAAEIVASALEGTKLEQRGAAAAASITDLADSSELSRSVSNLVKEVRAMDASDPGWARPAVSLKNEDRKDI
ncbi:MAG: hypothetical protein LBS92_01265 [Candidatus Methanoplasma sp.]|jgi:hypothetical protein|nr:hypothetical protein [Candidatus Methanoplasma sp.]